MLPGTVQWGSGEGRRRCCCCMLLPTLLLLQGGLGLATASSCRLEGGDSEAEARLARCISQCLHAPVVPEAAAVEAHLPGGEGGRDGGGRENGMVCTRQAMVGREAGSRQMCGQSKQAKHVLVFQVRGATAVLS